MKAAYIFPVFFIIVISFQSCKKDNNSPANIIAKHINDSLWAYYPIKGNTADITML
jgi:hypothetical protein